MVSDMSHIRTESVSHRDLSYAYTHRQGSATER